MKGKVIVFDLDDTLYKEIEYLKSAYKEISIRLKEDFEINYSLKCLIDMYYQGLNVFKEILCLHQRVGLDLKYLLGLYRNHKPDIKLTKEDFDLLNLLKDQGCELCLMTDGRSVTQRAKIESLGINDLMSKVLISEEFGDEKPSKVNYEFFEREFLGSQLYYVGDNLRKDFITAKGLGWITVGLRDLQGVNIHTQDLEVDDSHLPHYWINSLLELKYLI